MASFAGILAALVVARSALCATHSISVGAFANGTVANVFDPPAVKAAQGDSLEFVFKAGHHNAQGVTFATPCSAPASFDTGIMAGSASDPHTMTIKINETGPVYIVCKPHCEIGMVMVVNPLSTGETLDAFVVAAKGGSHATKSGNTDSSSQSSPQPPSSAVGGLSASSIVASASASGLALKPNATISTGSITPSTTSTPGAATFVSASTPAIAIALTLIGLVSCSL